MDLNQLLYHHQIAIMNALNAEKAGRIAPNFDMVRYYTKRINAYRVDKGLSPGFVSWASHSPNNTKACGQEFGPAIAISMQAAFVADLMIAESLASKAPTSSMLSSTPAPFVGDIIQMISDMQGKAQAITLLLMDRLNQDEDKVLVNGNGLLTSQLDEWENEGGAQAVKPRPPLLKTSIPPKSHLAMTVERNVHDIRAQALRDKINIRNIMDPSNDD
ncbi:hypothetical protein [Sphingopyxis yananensis]|uniref:hypothetical protein n=1 Tax=Sphingopyxis yananensis TaxID=2886687 RepID=UPI001D0F827D|nr:hypothetical protein [Sphingopyxis yananensis]MCC2602753.1 hypothetical protein [Sphingopyxis yananensis]